MRDLQADLAICEAATPGPIQMKPCACGRCNQFLLSITHADGRFDPENAKFIVEAREGWPEAIQRALKAEAEVVTLTNQLYNCGKAVFERDQARQERDNAEDKVDRLEDELRMLQDALNQRYQP
ncbi:hypothetical protein [Gorillibacterium timonense]|uniref:hypothetical protein n=1 Tax=Gorillibacterium timonense TaxID=1689269 RepID=UPI00071C9550|nr:hypothetical protein [Gorillibacterium timonense]